MKRNENYFLTERNQKPRATLKLHDTTTKENAI